MIVDSTANAFPLKHTYEEVQATMIIFWGFPDGSNPQNCFYVYPIVKMSYLIGGLEHFIYFSIYWEQ